MKILVVGGAGYVGGGIVDTLSKKNEITVYDSLIYESAYRKDVNFIYGDIRDYKKINPILNNFDPSSPYLRSWPGLFEWKSTIS